jgi:hypothetical protein
MRHQAVLFLLGLLVAFAPSTALAKKPKQARGDSVNATRLTPYFGAAGAGHGFERGPRWDDYWRYGMRGGGQVGARLEVPVAEFVSLGGMAEFGATSIRNANRADLHLDFDFWVKGRYVFALSPFDLEIYVGVPIGMSFAFVDWGDPGREFGPGMNSGLLFGGQFLFKRGGFFAEMGGRFRRTWYGDGWSWGTRQFNANFGGVLLF